MMTGTLVQTMLKQTREKKIRKNKTKAKKQSNKTTTANKTDTKQTIGNKIWHKVEHKTSRFADGTQLMNNEEEEEETLEKHQQMQIINLEKYLTCF